MLDRCESQWLSRFQKWPAIFCTVLFLYGSLTGCSPSPDHHQSAAQSQPTNNAEQWPKGPAEPPITYVNTDALRRGEVIRIQPRWDFYWNKLLSPEDISNYRPSAQIQGMEIWRKLGYESTGYATYRTIVPVPVNRPFGLRISQQLTSARLFLDGRLVAEDGSPGMDADTTVPARSNLTVEYSSRTGMVELVLQIANFHSFRGGARGTVEVGPIDSIRQAQSLDRSLELLASGFLFSIALYHFFLFSMQRRQWVYLVFALICLSFALRIPLLGEKAIDQLWPGLSWEFQYRCNMGLNIVTPPLLMLFFHLLFPAALNRKLLHGFLILCAILSLSIFLDTINLGRIMFAYYLVAAGPALLMGFYMAFKYGIRQKGSSRTMAAGMGVVSVLGLLAIYQNWYTREDAGQLAILAFVSFGFFQAVGVAQRHKESIEKEQRLSASLERSRRALSHQRQSLESDLHDSMGSKLVDLKLQINGPRALDAKELGSTVDELYSLFRGQLLFMEDLEDSARDPITALQLSLLRRYSAAGRELRFRVTEDQKATIHSILMDDTLRMDFLQFCRELCTNDLKYGAGEALWAIKAKDQQLRLIQCNRIGARSHLVESDSAFEQGQMHQISVHARKRAVKLGGQFEIRILGSHFICNALIPAQSLDSL